MVGGDGVDAELDHHYAGAAAAEHYAVGRGEQPAGGYQRRLRGVDSDAVLRRPKGVVQLYAEG